MQRIRYALQILAVWTIPAVVGQIGWTVAGGERSITAIGWGLFYQAAYWYPWSLLTPLILRLADRYSILTGRTALTLLRHLGFSVGFALLHQVLHIIPYNWMEGHAFFSDEFWSGAQFFFVYTTNVSMVTYFGIAAFGWWRQYARRARAEAVRSAELETELAQLRLQLLRGQLQPHFLFNALNTVAGLIHDDPERADRMVGQLSRLLRSSLSESEHTTIPLERELAILETYCEIQQTRFKQQVRFEYHIAATARSIPVPPFILQPLVENAVHHGLSRSGQHLTVTIAAAVEQDRLRLTVSDDGTGLGPNWRGEEQYGVGLGNTAHRLAYLYNGDAKLLITPNEPGGASAIVEMPPQPRRQLGQNPEKTTR